MKIEDLVGQFCRRPTGYRVFVDTVAPSDGPLPDSAFGHYIDGPDKGSRTRCFVRSLQPLGREVPIVDDWPASTRGINTTS